MGKGLVDKLKQEFDLRVEWLGFEIHPETPPEGTPLVKMFPQADAESMGAQFGITFQKITHVSNSRMSLEAAEFAREHNRFDQFHDAVFQAYFSQGKDIGNVAVLKQIGKHAGLDEAALQQALQTGAYRPLIENVRQEAVRLGVNAAPTFIIEDKGSIVGAQSIDVFRDRLRSR